MFFVLCQSFKNVFRLFVLGKTFQLNLKICVPNVLPWFVVWHATELQQAQSLAEDLSKHFFLLSRQDGDFRVKLFIVQHVHSSCYTFSVYLRLWKKDRSLLQDLCCLLKSLTEVNWPHSLTLMRLLRVCLSSLSASEQQEAKHVQ